MNRADRLVFWGDIDGYYNEQAEESLRAAEAILDKHPVHETESATRAAAFLLLDTVLHEEAAPTRPAVQQFLHRRSERIATELERRRIPRGVQVFKIYDAAVVVRTRSVTIGFDLSRGCYLPTPAVPDPVMARIADQCDALFISHRHEDHADPWVSARFLEDGKPVYAPRSAIDGALTGGETCLQRRPDLIHEVRFGRESTPGSCVVYPGHQGDLVENNAYLVRTPDGVSVAHLGDQSCDADFEWIDRVAHSHRTDVLFPNCWSNDLLRVIRGFRPRFVIPVHENELGHTVDHREAHWLTRKRLAGTEATAVIMTWGEVFDFLPSTCAH